MRVVIDIPDDVYEDIEHGKGDFINTLNWAVRNGTPISNEGDLISRSELKKAIMNDLGLGDEENGSDAEYMSGLQDCYNLIDNAPTVAKSCNRKIKRRMDNISNKPFDTTMPRMYCFIKQFKS